MKTESRTRLRIGTKLKLAAALGILIMAAFAVGYSIGQGTPTFSTIIEDGSMVTEADYIIFESGGETFARNGQTGAISFSNADAQSAIQSALNALPASGGHVAILGYGSTYTLNKNISVPSNTTLEGVGQPTLRVADGAATSFLCLGTCFIAVTNTAYNGTAGDFNENITIRGLELDMNKAGSGVSDQYGIMIRYSTNILIEENVIHSSNRLGIGGSFNDRIGGGSAGDRLHSGFRIQNNHLYGHDIAAINTDATPGAVIRDNYIHDSRRGIYFESGSNRSVVSGNQISSVLYGVDSIGASIPNTTITENTVSNVQGVSIWGSNGAGIFAGPYSTISNNLILNAFESNLIGIQAGDYSIISDNVVWGDFNNDIRLASHTLASGNQLYTGTGYAFWIQAGNNNTVHHNVGDAVTFLREAGASDYNRVWFNTIVSGGFTLVGGNTTVRYNQGYATENEGSATILNGQTSVSVTHGLVGTPTVVLVTGAHSETQDIWVSSIGATTFTINVTPAVTADRTVYWVAYYW